MRELTERACLAYWHQLFMGFSVVTKTLGRGTVFNILGGVIPIAASVATIPFLLTHIGHARFGVMAIVWTIVGYFGVFDFGLSRTMANQISKLRSADEELSVFWTTIWLNFIFGMVGGALLYATTGVIMSHFLKMPDSLQAEALKSLPWIAASVPVCTLSGVCVGALDGKQQFGIANVLQGLGSVLLQVAPMVSAIIIGPELSVIIPATVIGRGLSGAFLAVAAIRALKIQSIRLIEYKQVPVLLGYSSWVAVTGLVGPILETFDRIVLGKLVGAGAVGYYSVPFSIADKLRIFPRAVCRTLFPVLSTQTRGDAKILAARATRVIALAMTAAIAPGIQLVGPLLSIWVGADFAAVATPIAQLLLVGVWANGLANVPYTLLQAQGKPGILARFQVLELVPFVILVYALIHKFGLIGAPLAWAIRAILDSILFFAVAGIGFSNLVRTLPSAILIALSLASGLLLKPTIFQSIVIAAAFSVCSAAWLIYTEPVMAKKAFKRVGLAGGQ
ncbi:hypothetical protein DSC91_002474 [Paraburkholderia caffeinilytica]|uniref:flippase n=1 Tax=Paraburkholderia caffeinilytica TaxID=1761016 RepID=UPI000E2141BD|nr:flippase [Paraburkholderia caffeinilytica]AXL50326.1 hypothetical protein DSC91_002474 [Paraburkholderia caffeinilytica]CAB3804523.1 hypothetical protein LMG28690_06047 [Paraburkholderia caffeinilytica]